MLTPISPADAKTDNADSANTRSDRNARIRAPSPPLAWALRRLRRFTLSPYCVTPTGSLRSRRDTGGDSWWRNKVGAPFRPGKTNGGQWPPLIVDKVPSSLIDLDLRLLHHFPPHVELRTHAVVEPLGRTAGCG